MAKRKSIHYVKNADFSQAVVDYVMKVNEAKEQEKAIPLVPDYIAKCFLRIAEGLSHKSNFIRYTYREEMVITTTLKRLLEQASQMLLLTLRKFLGMLF